MTICLNEILKLDLKKVLPLQKKHPGCGAVG